MKRVAQVLYAVNGTGLLVAGLSLLFGSPGWIAQVLGIDQGKSLPDVLFHLFSEAGALLLFASVLCFWHVVSFESRRAFHWAMTFFWILMAAIHAVGTFQSGSPAIYAIVNSLPALAYLVTAPGKK